MKCKPSKWKRTVSAVTIDIQMREKVMRTGGSGMERKKVRKMNRIAGWFMMVVLAAVIIPIGIVMFVVSGLWSAADRALLRFNR